jgi:YhgE/Pip-like protein
MTTPGTPTESPSKQLAARDILRLGPIWTLPIAISGVLIILIAFTYIGSVVNPTGHLKGLPVLVVDQDTGANTPAGQVNLGQHLVAELTHTSAITSRLAVQVVSLATAEHDMDKGDDYGALVIPPTFSASLIQLTGLEPSSSAPLPSLELLTNIRLGSLGVSLASGVITPAVAVASHQIGAQLTKDASPSARASVTTAALLANPVSLTSSQYRPLPSHTALGLSAFYVALLSIMCGFLGATVINSGVDAALGYGATEIGPKYRQRKPLSINRRQTLLVKWAMALVIAPILTALLLLIGAGVLRMYAPHLATLWLFISLSAITVAIGTLALFAALGSLGQLVAMIIFIYLALASSGGTVPIQALPGVFRVVGRVEPLRLILYGCRSILYFGARSDAGLGHSVVIIAAELLVWLAVGLAITTWYDRRKLHRLAPEVISFIERAVDVQQAAGADQASE